jgi:hypothetical protein
MAPRELPPRREQSCRNAPRFAAANSEPRLAPQRLLHHLKKMLMM